MLNDTKTPVNCLLADGGMGDHIAALVAVNYILENYKHINLLIWVPDYLKDFAKNVLPENAIVRNYTEAKKKYDATKTGISTAWRSQHTPMKVHPVDYAFHMLCDEHVDYNKKNYLKIKFDKVDISNFSLPKNYVVIAATSAEKVKTMPTETMNKIIDYVIEKGCTPVFVGKKEVTVGYEDMKIKSDSSDGINLHKGINLIDKTNLLELGKIIEGSRCFVGMDGGLVHLAGCSSTYIITGYTFIDGKKHNIPIRNNELGWKSFIVEPDQSLNCRFCQTYTNFLYGHDYRTCLLKENKYECTKHMTFDKFKVHLDYVLADFKMR